MPNTFSRESKYARKGQSPEKQKTFDEPAVSQTIFTDSTTH